MNITDKVASGKETIMDIEERLRVPIETAQKEARARIEDLGKMIVKRPARSLGIAFLVGFGVARLLQKIT